MATKKDAEVVGIKALDMRTVRVKIVGITPLITHAWSQKAKRMMLDAQMGKKAGKQREKKNPVDDFINSLYWLTEPPAEPTEDAFNEAIEAGARFGFPLTGIKQAGISAAYRAGWAKDKVSLRGAFYITGDTPDMVEIHGDPPIMREDMCRIGMGVADIRYRGEFRNWWMEFDVTYNANGPYDLESILNIINLGGTACGLGEWRVERDGQFGMYRLATD